MRWLTGEGKRGGGVRAPALDLVHVTAQRDCASFNLTFACVALVVRFVVTEKHDAMVRLSQCSLWTFADPSFVPPGRPAATERSPGARVAGTGTKSALLLQSQVDYRKSRESWEQLTKANGGAGGGAGSEASVARTPSPASAGPAARRSSGGGKAGSEADGAEAGASLPPPPPPLKEESPRFLPESPSQAPVRKARTARGSEEGPLPAAQVEVEMAASSQVRAPSDARAPPFQIHVSRRPVRA
jgi:hypothetical protein